MKLSLIIGVLKKIKAYYPQSTSLIMHKSLQGKIYRLDGFDKSISLYKKLLANDKYEVRSINSKLHENLAKELITLCHTPEVLNAYKTGDPKELANSSGVLWQEPLYEYILEEALCTKYAVETAMEERLAIVLSGGGHHAERNRPLGFCPINTMALAATCSTKNSAKTALIDLDVHYSNGCFDILKNNDHILCTSIWSKKIDKWAYYESEGNIWHRHVADSAEYFRQLSELGKLIEKWKPDFVAYHLGLDVLSSDRMGGVSNFSIDDLYKREEFVSHLLRRLKVPYVIFLGGAYVDYSKGEEYIKKQKRQITNYLQRALNIHIANI